MRTSEPSEHQKRAAILAGAGLSIMALLAPVAFFAVLEPIRAAGDAGAQADALLASQGMFRVSIAIFMAVAVLDVLVAWALHGTFGPANPHLSLFAAWFRLVYTGVLLVATASLIEALNLALDPALPAVWTESRWSLLVQHELNGFFSTFNFGLGVFGCHLVVLGYLTARSGLLPRILSALIVIAGLGYLADTLGTLLIGRYDLKLASVTFIGEVLLIGWLFWWGFRRTMTTDEREQDQ